MIDSEKTPLRIFESNFSTEAIDQDRKAIATFLDEYLATGKTPEVPILATGSIRLDGRREPIGQGSWKWSEMHGKYAGCMFWSVEASNTFEHVAAKYPERSSQTIGRMASAKKLRDHSLQHEHVFPRKAWVEMMTPNLGQWEAGNSEELAARMDEFCIACIVTHKEHQELTDQAVTSNPWQRYKGTSIRLKRNPEWPDQHRVWIEEAGLVDPVG